MVRTKSGREYFLGADFDVACSDGRYFQRGLNELSRVAKMIAASGRRVVFTVAPNKSSVDTVALRGRRLPHGSCARRGLESQARLLDTYGNSRFIKIRSMLEADQGHVYWKGDAHWNYVGSSMYAQRLVSKLAPRIGAAIRFAPTRDRRVGDIRSYLGQTPQQATERNKGLVPRTKAKVAHPRGTREIDSEAVTTYDYRWHTTPRRGAYRGKTVLLGDSFTYLSLRSLRPSVANGHFLWTGFNPQATTVDAVLEADTVVIEVVQRFVSASLLIQPAFRDALRAALANDARAPGRDAG